MTTEYRVCNTEDLTELIRLDKGAAPVTALLDPDGSHLLHRVLYGHNMDFSDVVSHRCRVMVAVLHQPDPIEMLLDIEDTLWKRLHTVESVLGETA